MTREVPTVSARLNRDLLAQLMEALATLGRPDHIAPATLDGLLNVRGVIETVEVEEDEAEREAAQENILKGLGSALASSPRCARARGRRWWRPLP